MSLGIQRNKVVKLVALVMVLMIALLIPMTANAASSASVKGSGIITFDTGKGWGPFYIFKPEMKITTDKDIAITIENQNTGAIKYVNVNKGTTKISVDKNTKIWVYITGRGSVFGNTSNSGANVTISNSYSCSNFRKR